MATRKKENPLIVIIGIVIVILMTFASEDINIFNNEEEQQSNVVSSNLKVYFFDVGQADSILISNNDHNMLIDAGNNEDGTKLVSYIKELGITKFDYVIGTHPHEDHIGGLDDVIDNFDIDNVYLPNVTTTTETFNSLLTSIENKGLTITVPTIGDKIKLGEADLEFIYTGTNTDNLNDSSIIIKMIFGNYSYLFTGDASSTVEQKILDKNIDVDVLKVAHHGSKYSSSISFLNKVTPKYAIISVGKDNSYGHPNEETITNLKKYTENIYRTDELGTIEITSDGNYIDVNSFFTDTNGG